MIWRTETNAMIRKVALITGAAAGIDAVQVTLTGQTSDFPLFVHVTCLSGYGPLLPIPITQWLCGPTNNEVMDRSHPRCHMQNRVQAASIRTEP